MVAIAQTGKVINVKKPQFLAPAEMRHILAKCAEESSGIETPEGKAFNNQIRALEDFVGFASKMSDRISSMKYGFAVQMAAKLLG